MEDNSNSKLDIMHCESIAKSISQIIRFSLDEEFRKKAFQVLKVFSTKEAEMEICKKLVTLLTDGEKTCLDNESQSDSIEQNQDLESDINTEKNDSQNIFSPLNFQNKNWLKISSDIYRENSKNRKFYSLSQPSIRTRDDEDEEYMQFLTRTDFSYSCPDTQYFKMK